MHRGEVWSISLDRTMGAEIKNQEETFKSDAVIPEPLGKRGDLETFSMVMRDFDYNETGKVFDLNHVHYADDVRKGGQGSAFRHGPTGQEDDGCLPRFHEKEARAPLDAMEFKKGGGSRLRVRDCERKANHDRANTGNREAGQPAFH